MFSSVNSKDCLLTYTSYWDGTNTPCRRTLETMQETMQENERKDHAGEHSDRILDHAGGWAEEPCRRTLGVANTMQGTERKHHAGGRPTEPCRRLHSDTEPCKRSLVLARWLNQRDQDDTFRNRGSHDALIDCGRGEMRWWMYNTQEYTENFQRMILFQHIFFIVNWIQIKNKVTS